MISDFSNQIIDAYENNKTITIKGGGSKSFYGNHTQTDSQLDINPYKGVIMYEPSELVINVRAGTSLREIEQLLNKNGQKFPFDPPHYSDTTTIGGVVATGLSGPERPYSGSVRDAVLGVKMINGKGEVLEFGGQMMKNVAGYDVSRLMVGSLGILGLILEVSIKVIPMPEMSKTIIFDSDISTALSKMRDLAKRSLPITATAWVNEQSYIRLSGNNKIISDIHNEIGGEDIGESDVFWNNLRDQYNSFFDSSLPLWRLSVSASTQRTSFDGEQLIEWGGALRWVNSDASPDYIHDIANHAGGHATLFRSKQGYNDDVNVFEPLSSPLMGLHKTIKDAFDPAGIFNPNRLYKGI